MRVPDARGGRVRFGALLGALMVLATGCVEQGPQDALDPAGEFARKADSLWDLTFGIAVVVFFLVEGFLVFTLLRYRQRPGREAAQFHGNTRLEVVLTVVPALILAGIAVPTVRTIFDLAQNPSNALRVKVVGHRFWWEFQYPDQQVMTANELHIPTGQPVRLELEGASTDRVDPNLNEIIHSFWVPRLAGTQDLIPGRTNYLLLETDKADVYLGQCKEFCGLSHANMKLRVVAQAPDDFDAWLQDQKQTSRAPRAGLAAQGAKLFAEGAPNISQPCSGCHASESASVEAQPNVGPNLANFADRETFAGAMFENTPENLRPWLDEPAEVKPGATMPDVGLTPEQINALIAYLQTRN